MQKLNLAGNTEFFENLLPQLKRNCRNWEGSILVKNLLLLEKFEVL